MKIVITCVLLWLVVMGLCVEGVLGDTAAKYLTLTLFLVGIFGYLRSAYILHKPRSKNRTP